MSALSQRVGERRERLRQEEGKGRRKGERTKSWGIGIDILGMEVEKERVCLRREEREKRENIERET